MNTRQTPSRQPGRDRSRLRRYILAGAFTLLALGLTATQIFLHQTSVGSPRFVRMTFILLAGTVFVGMALLVLATVLGRNLIKLYFERKRGQVGSRFKAKMVTTFVALSLLPALLLFFLAYGLIISSIDLWFRAPASQMLENSRMIGEQYYDELDERSRHFAGRIAVAMGGEEAFLHGIRPRLEQKLSVLRQDYALEDVRIFDARANLAAESGKLVPTVDAASELRNLVQRSLVGQAVSRVVRSSPSDALKEVVWATASIRSPDGRIVGAVVTQALITRSVHFKVSSVQEGYNAYAQLQTEKASVRSNFLLILALSTLLIVFAFSWFAMYLAKRITVPIQALAEGAEAVAAGNLGHRVECEAFDELESLVAAFNQMTSDLEENKSRIEAAQDSLRQSNAELDDRRRYIETILQAIATGVLSLDSNYRIRTMNRAAYQMFAIQGPVTEIPLEEVVQGSAGETIKQLMHKSAVLGPVVRNIELSVTEKHLQLATTVTPLLDSSGQQAGWVIALDDVTELLRMEKLSAWREVARRLAHEIKNPLTPIQLSAERMLRRYRKLPPLDEAGERALGSWHDAFLSYGNLLEECVLTITREANSLKNLVDEFSRFARLPEIKLRDEDLHKVLENVLSLYNGRIQDVTVIRTFSPDVPHLRLDPEQMKRVFVNLFDNALEAMADSPRAKVLKICTSCERSQRSVRIQISDTGRGFPKEYQDSLFLPYFSTRKGGTGLGLAIVRQIISDHNGYVRAEPNLPLGTTIVIDLPLPTA